MKIYFEEMNNMGEVKFRFSEPLLSIDEIDRINLTSISDDRVFEVKY